MISKKQLSFALVLVMASASVASADDRDDYYREQDREEARQEMRDLIIQHDRDIAEAERESRNETLMSVGLVGGTTVLTVGAVLVWIKSFTPAVLAGAKKQLEKAANLSTPDEALLEKNPGEKGTLSASAGNEDSKQKGAIAVLEVSPSVSKVEGAPLSGAAI